MNLFNIIALLHRSKEKDMHMSRVVFHYTYYGFKHVGHLYLESLLHCMQVILKYCLLITLNSN